MKQQKSGKTKLKIYSYGADEEIQAYITDYQKETGVNATEINRRAIRKFFESGCNESVVMLNLIQLTQTVNEMKEVIPKEKYEQLQQYIGNIMTIKGGK